MTAKEILQAKIGDILKKGWEGDALADNEALLDAFLKKIDEAQAQALLDMAEKRFTKGKATGVMGDPRGALAFGIALMIATRTSIEAEKESSRHNSIDKLAENMVNEMPGQEDGREWSWIEFFEQTTKGDNKEIYVKSTPPQNAIVIVDKLTHALPTAYFNEGKGVSYNVATGDGKEKQDLIVFILEADEDNIIKYGKKITPFDIRVNDGVCGLLSAGNEFFTLKQLIRHIKAKGDTYNPTKSYYNKVKRSIDKQLTTRIKVDLGRLVDYKKKTQKNYLAVMNDKGIDVKRTYIEDNMLSLTTIRTRINGASVDAYKAKYDRDKIEMPIRYRVAQFTGEIKTISVSAFNVPKLKNTDRNDLLLPHLVRELWRIRDGSSSNKMRYDSLYAACTPSDDEQPVPGGEKGADERQKEAVERSRFRADVKSILSYWISEGYFDGFKNYKEYRKGRELVGVEIIFKRA